MLQFMHSAPPPLLETGRAARRSGTAIAFSVSVESVWRWFIEGFDGDLSFSSSREESWTSPKSKEPRGFAGRVLVSVLLLCSEVAVLRSEKLEAVD